MKTILLTFIAVAAFAQDIKPPVIPATLQAERWRSIAHRLLLERQLSETVREIQGMIAKEQESGAASLKSMKEICGEKFVVEENEKEAVCIVKPPESKEKPKQ